MTTPWIVEDHLLNWEVQRKTELEEKAMFEASVISWHEFSAKSGIFIKCPFLESTNGNADTLNLIITFAVRQLLRYGKWSFSCVLVLFFLSLGFVL